MIPEQEKSAESTAHIITGRCRQATLVSNCVPVVLKQSQNKITELYQYNFSKQSIQVWMYPKRKHATQQQVSRVAIDCFQVRNNQI
jgi:hypothetical protein